jgi:hypothetical protein
MLSLFFFQIGSVVAAMDFNDVVEKLKDPEVSMIHSKTKHDAE